MRWPATSLGRYEANLSTSTSPFISQLADANPAQKSLNEKLAALQARIEGERPDIARAYNRLVERLAAIDQGGVGPALGARFPDFMMPDQSGALVSLQSLLQRGPLIVSFNRGHWCPYCKLDLRALASALPEIQRFGGEVVSIMPDTATFTGPMHSADSLPFPVLSDIDLGYTLSLGLVYWVGADVVALCKELGIELERYQGNENHFMPLVAKFVVGRDGTVKARHVDIEFRRRLEVLDLLSAIKGDR